MNSRINTNNAQILPTFDYTITLLNKVKAQDTADKRSDVWFKTVLHYNHFSAYTMRDVTGTTASVANVLTARVPKNPAYKPYAYWIKDPAQGFTFSPGDIVIKGEIEETIITPQTINIVLQKYQPNAFTIKTFKDNTGTVELGEHYHVEGI